MRVFSNCKTTGFEVMWVFSNCKTTAITSVSLLYTAAIEISVSRRRQTRAMVYLAKFKKVK